MKKFGVWSLLAILLVTTLQSVYAYRVYGNYTYHEKVNTPSVLLSSMHDPDGKHNYRQDKIHTGTGKPSYEEANQWWKEKVANTPLIIDLMTDRQIHCGISYEAVTMMMCEDCHMWGGEPTKRNFEDLEQKETEAYDKSASELVAVGFDINSPSGKSLDMDKEQWYLEYEAGRLDKRDSMTSKLHDSTHKYKTSTSQKPTYEEAMAWWAQELSKDEEVKAQYNDREIAGEGMYEWICTLMCAECTPSKADEKILDRVRSSGSNLEYKMHMTEKELADEYKELESLAESQGYKVISINSDCVSQEEARQEYFVSLIAGYIAIGIISFQAICLVLAYVIKAIKKNK